MALRVPAQILDWYPPWGGFVCKVFTAKGVATDLCAKVLIVDTLPLKYSYRSSYGASPTQSIEKVDCFITLILAAHMSEVRQVYVVPAYADVSGRGLTKIRNGSGRSTSMSQRKERGL